MPGIIGCLKPVVQSYLEKSSPFCNSVLDIISVSPRSNMKGIVEIDKIFPAIVISKITSGRGLAVIIIQTAERSAKPQFYAEFCSPPSSIDPLSSKTERAQVLVPVVDPEY